MTVRWVWAFLDLPEEGFAESVEFWRQVSRSRLSPWRGDGRQFATLLPEDGDPWLKVQRVSGPGGVHVDLDIDVPLDEAAAQAESLGARVRQRRGGVVVCESPGGFGFCLADWRHHGAPRRQVRRRQPSLVDQVCLDIPASRYAGEVAFWSSLTGWAVDKGHPDEFVRLAWPQGRPVHFLLQRLDEEDGPVRGHLDLAARDRRAEVERHVVLGAQEEGPGRGWTVMSGPAGHRYCITDRSPEVTNLSSTG
jgi:hypothetical protein